MTSMLQVSESLEEDDEQDDKLWKLWQLARSVFELRPELMLKPHVPSRLSEAERKTQDFEGETCMHIMIVHSSPGHGEERLLDMLDIADRQFRGLDREQKFEELLLTQAVGHFFERLPMRHYGATPLCYALCFELKVSFRRMLQLLEDYDGSRGLLQNKTHACELTGLMPVHALVGCSLESM